MRAGLSRLAGIALAFCAVAGPAGADDTDLLGILDGSIVTTASQTAETASTAPATSTSIDADDLRRYGIHTLEEAINFLALGMSSTGGRTARMALDLGARGVALANDSSSHFLLLIDGHAVNEPFLGAIAPDYGLGIPLEVVDHIEAVVGPGSVLYGTDAMLGVINVVTKSGASMSGGHVVAEAELPVGNRAAAFGGSSFRLLGEQAELRAAGQYWNQYGPDYRLGPQRLGIDPVSGRPARTTRDGPESGIWGGLAERSNYARNLSASLQLQVGHLEIALRAALDDQGRPFSPHDFDDPGSGLATRQVALDAKYWRLLTPQLRIGLRGYADGLDARETLNFSQRLSCPYQGVRTCHYETRAVSRWAGVEAQASYDWMGNARATTLVGVDVRLRSVGTKQDAQDADTGEYLVDSFGLIDEQDSTLGVYAQQIWWPVPALGLNAGARLDRDPRFSPVVSPRAAASLSIWRGATLRSIYAEAFRSPSFYQSDYGDPLKAKPEGLRAETVRSMEASFEQRLGPHRLFFGVFRSWWYDLIEVRFLSHEQAVAAAERGLLPLAIPSVVHSQHQNAASIDSYGFNAGVEGRWVAARLRYGLNVSEAYSRRDSAGAEDALLPTAPRLTGNARLAYEPPAPFPTLALTGYLLAPRLIDRGLEAGFTPPPFAPLQLDLRATVTGRVPFVQGCSYRVSADRVFGNRAPYAIGTLERATADNPSAELSPIARFRFSLGVQFDFGQE